jgi:hypothetical protein
MHKCKNCGGLTKNKMYCSHKCANTDPSLIQAQSKKRKATFIDRYGVDNPLKVESIKNKAHATCIDRYGFKSPAKNEGVKLRCKSATIDKYKRNWGDMVHSFIAEGYTVITTPETYKEQIIEFICPNGHHHYTLIYNWHKGNRCGKCEVSKVSQEETEVAQFLSNYVKVECNNRDIIWPYEIDINIPDHNIAVEYNGLFWHSEKSGKPKNYHMIKTIKCSDLGIKLIHIFDDEWKNKKEIVKSILLSKLGLYNERLYGRNCRVAVIDCNTKNDFLTTNHIQGKDNSSIHLGLYFNDELLSIMTFGKRKITGSEPLWEMIRYCNKLNTQIVGGASKLFTYFKNNYNIDRVISYADRRWSVGDLYHKLGFKFENKTKLNYWYTIDYKNRAHRSGFQKHLLHNKINNFDPNLTEWDNMQANGYDRIWDCGNLMFSYNKTSEV